MGISVRRALSPDVPVQHHTHSDRTAATPFSTPLPHAPIPTAEPAPKIRVLLAAENRLLREALARMLAKQAGIQVSAVNPVTTLPPETSARLAADVLLLSSRGSIEQDLTAIQQARAGFPQALILLIGMSHDPAEFLQCVRAGVRGYLLCNASSEEILDAVRAVHSGAAVCPASLCVTLFRYFEHEAAALFCGSPRLRLGLTRREQQLIPFLAQGLTNKEIANHFSLSEQTVKNHVYRMKHKINAHDRLDIVHLYRTHTFLV